MKRIRKKLKQWLRKVISWRPNGREHISWWQQLLSYWFLNTNKAKEKIPDAFQDGTVQGETRLPWNIYEGGTGVTYKEHLRKFDKINFGFKYRIFKPGVVLAKKFLGNYIEEEVPDEPHNRFLQAFHNSWHKSVRDLFIIFCRNQKGGYENGVEGWERTLNRPYSTAGVLKTIGNIGTTFGLNDNAIREFFNFFMINSFLEVHKILRESGGEFHHLLYNDSNIFNVHYYNLYATVANIGRQKQEHDITVRPVFDNEEDEERYRQRNPGVPGPQKEDEE